MFMRDVNGRAVRIDPTREFHNGDRIVSAQRYKQVATIFAQG